MLDWNSQQWNEGGEFDAAFIIITPRTAGGFLWRMPAAQRQADRAGHCWLVLKAVTPVRWIHQGLAATGASSLAATSVLRKPVSAVAVGASASAAAYGLRKQVFTAAAGSSAATSVIRRIIRAALVAIGASDCQAVLSKLVLPAPARGNMRVGPWTRPAFVSGLRFHRWLSPA
jgi:hypothetical protein